MARPVTVTKERILSAALDLVRSGGPAALTARNLCARLGCGANAIFSSFGSIQGVRDAVREEARKLYRKRVGDGFSLNPPFKGFGMALIWFAMDEPQLFSLVMESQTPPTSYKEYIDSYVGFKAESLSAIEETFGLPEKDAETLYYQLVLVALGVASTCTSGRSQLSIPQVSEILGKNVRAFLMVIRAGNDDRERFVPKAGEGPGGEVDSYVLMHALVGQNHLLQELRAKPRYIQDEEWAELHSLTPAILRIRAGHPAGNFTGIRHQSPAAAQSKTGLRIHGKSLSLRFERVQTSASRPTDLLRFPVLSLIRILFAFRLSNGYPSTISSTIIRANPRAKPMVPMLECSPWE